MKKFLVSFLIIISLFCLSGCDKNSQDLENEKNVSEIMYLENRLITISQKFLQDDYNLENSEIDCLSSLEDNTTLYLVRLDNNPNLRQVDYFSNNNTNYGNSTNYINCYEENCTINNAVISDVKNDTTIGQRILFKNISR